MGTNLPLKRNEIVRRAAPIVSAFWITPKPDVISAILSSRELPAWLSEAADFSSAIPMSSELIAKLFKRITVTFMTK